MSAIAEGRPAGLDIDPITFEVVRNKLQAITEEQAITLKSVSGSPVVVLATDFNNGIYLADGSIVTMGPQVLFHTGTMSSVIRSIIDNYSENPGIREGDMFILNDPYLGAVHQPDISIVAPIFHEGRHIAWAGSCAHELDVGGSNFGSWVSNATEIQQEGLLLPGVKLVEGGVIRQDIWQMIMGMTRLPLMVGLDLKAMIAANHVAEKRLREVMGRYGAGLVEDVMRTEIDTSERQLRARLRSLPDGVYRAVDYVDHDGHENNLHEVRLAVRKTGEELVFDLAGTSEQALGFINCTRSGLIGGLMTALLPILAPDIRWNEGVLRPVTVDAPEGTLVNATRPAPVSGATVSAVWLAMNTGVAALSRLVACSAGTAAESQAVTKGNMAVLTLSGADRDGGAFGTMVMDATAGGGGAYEDHDGLDASGDFVVPRPSIGNVEECEVDGPYLYLYRRFVADTGGPGRMRGGATTGVAVTPHDSDELYAVLISHGVEVPNSIGLFGGLEGSCAQNWIRRATGDGTDVTHARDHAALAELGGLEPLGAKPGPFALHRGDVVAYSFEGGGGYGDPIERDPARVERDVENGMVSAAGALRHYGVVVGDPDGTRAAREAMRVARLGGSQPTSTTGALTVHDDEVRMGSQMKRDASGRVRCRCGHDLGPATANWKQVAASRVVDPADHGPHLLLHAELELREHACPACAALLESEVARTGEPSLFSVELR